MESTWGKQGQKKVIRLQAGLIRIRRADKQLQGAQAQPQRGLGGDTWHSTLGGTGRDSLQQ